MLCGYFLMDDKIRCVCVCVCVVCFNLLLLKEKHYIGLVRMRGVWAANVLLTSSDRDDYRCIKERLPCAARMHQ